MTVIRPGDLRMRQLPGRRSADPFEGLGAGLGLSMRIAELPSGVSRAPHRHPRTAEAMRVAEGTGHLWLEGDVTPVGPGDIVLIPRGAAHATIPDPGETMTLVCFFPDEDLSSNIEELDEPIEFEEP